MQPNLVREQMGHPVSNRIRIFSGGENETVVLTVATELRNNEVYIGVYVTWMYLVVMNIVPFLSLAVFNLAIYLEVRRANSERAQLTRSDIREQGTSIRLFPGCENMWSLVETLRFPACRRLTKRNFLT